MRDHILVVDDESAVRQLLASQLHPLGSTCSTARDGDEAPRLDDNIQVVVVSGHQDLESVRSCLLDGAYDHLLKPGPLKPSAFAVMKSHTTIGGDTLLSRRPYQRTVSHSEAIRRLVADRGRDCS